MAVHSGNLFAGIPDTLPDEQIEALLSAPHVRIERMLFEGAPEPNEGALEPDLSRPGLGLEIKRADAKKYAT